MAKKGSNKAAAIAAIGAALDACASGYQPVKLKTPYLWPDEQVWQRDWPEASTFVVYGPSPKRAGEATIYLCWSRQRRFPEVSMRPSMLLGAGGDGPETKAEGSVLLSQLAPPLADWMRFDEGLPAAEVLAPYVDVLKGAGLAFLERLARREG